MAKIRYKKICKYCGVEFETTVSKKEYCSYICADFRNRELAKNKNVVAIKEGEQCERLVVMKCAYCGKAFETSDARRKCCSKKCAKMRKAEYQTDFMRARRHGEKHSVKDIKDAILQNKLKKYPRKIKLKISDKMENIEHDEPKEIKIFFDDVWARIGAEKPKDWEYGKLKR